MAYNVSSAFREQLYSGESEFRAILTIGGTTIDNDQIASISISSPIIDDSKQVFYVGTFISQKITIKFKNMDGIDVHSGDNVDLSIGQYVNNEWVDVPIGKFLVDDLAEDYYEKCEISCLDYAVKFKPNIDYSLCFTDGKATIKEILEYICDYFNVEIGDYPTINDDVEIGTYDSTVSGKQWISYIAELKGCNAKIDRLGRLTLQPLKQSSNVPINALESASFELGEEFNVTKVTFFDAIRNYTYGDDEGNTLFIRQDNPFITDTKVVQNIYDNLCVDKYSASGKEFDIEDADAHPINVNTVYGETSQETYTGKNLLNTLNMANQTKNGITCTYDKNAQTITFNGTCTTDNTTFWFSSGNISLDGTYTLSYEVISGTITNTIASTRIQFQRYSDWAGIWLPLTQQNNSTTRNLPNYELTQNNIRFDNGVVVNNYKIRVQLEKNSTKTSWERYVGGIPSPNPDYPQDVNTVTGGNVFNIKGKNLFNISLYDGSDKTNSATVSNDGEILTFTSSNNDAYTPSLWQYANFYEHRQMAMEVNSSTQYTFSFDVDSTPNGKIYIYGADKDYVGIEDVGSINYSDTNRTLTFTTSANTKYLIFRFVLWRAVTIHISNIQLEKGSSKTEYEPYQSQSYELDLPVENLYNIATNTNGKVIGTDGSEVDSTGYCISDYIAVQPNTTYTISRIYENLPSSEDNMRLGLYTQNKTWIQRVNSSNKPYVYTTPSNCYFIRLSYQYTITNTNVQVELGSKANTYTPYGTTPIELNKIGTYQDYIYKENDKWYLHKETGKIVLNGSENWTLNKYSYFQAEVSNSTSDSSKRYGYSDHYKYEYNTGNNNIFFMVDNLIRIKDTSKSNANDFKIWLGTHNVIVDYVLNTPTNAEITYQPLIDQLNALQNAKLFEGTNHITIDTLNEKPSLDIDYFKDSHFSLWSLKTHNYGDFTLDAWDNIDYDLDGTHYLTLNNNNIKYEMSIMGDVESKIPTKQQEVTTNIIGGDDKTNIKKIKTTVDQLNASVDILSQQQTNTQTDVSQLQIDVNGINTTVERIENVEIGKDDTVGLRHRLSQTEQKVDTITDMFQITGGINIIRNSAFLLQDELWEFTDYGTSPYHTPLGNSYNSSLSGITVSVAEIKARSMKIKSKSENITNLKTDGTKYTFNFYHKQDADMTTTIKMYSTENNNIKAFDDIVITGQQPLKNYEISFIPTYANYTLEIIVASATSIGYAYLYDMMLNAGDKQSWQPASDEIYSTTLQMSRLGLQVYSVGDGTITLLGSDGLTSWETSDGKTKGRLVSKRTIDGDRVKTITTQSVKLVSDATKTDEELTHEDKWVETTTKVSGKIAKVIYMESGV